MNNTKTLYKKYGFDTKELRGLKHEFYKAEKGRTEINSISGDPYLTFRTIVTPGKYITNPTVPKKFGYRYAEVLFIDINVGKIYKSILFAQERYDNFFTKQISNKVINIEFYTIEDEVREKKYIAKLSYRKQKTKDKDNLIYKSMPLCSDVYNIVKDYLGWNYNHDHSYYFNYIHYINDDDDDYDYDYICDKLYR